MAVVALVALVAVVALVADVAEVAVAALPPMLKPEAVPVRPVPAPEKEDAATDPLRLRAVDH